MNNYYKKFLENKEALWQIKDNDFIQKLSNFVTNLKAPAELYEPYDSFPAVENLLHDSPLKFFAGKNSTVAAGFLFDIKNASEKNIIKYKNMKNGILIDVFRGIGDPAKIDHSNRMANTFGKGSSFGVYKETALRYADKGGAFIEGKLLLKNPFIFNGSGWWSQLGDEIQFGKAVKAAYPEMYDKVLKKIPLIRPNEKFDMTTMRIRTEAINRIVLKNMGHDSVIGYNSHNHMEITNFDKRNRNLIEFTEHNMNDYKGYKVIERPQNKFMKNREKLNNIKFYMGGTMKPSVYKMGFDKTAMRHISKSQFYVAPSNWENDVNIIKEMGIAAKLQKPIIFQHDIDHSIAKEAPVHAQKIKAAMPSEINQIREDIDRWRMNPQHMEDSARVKDLFKKSNMSGIKSKVAKLARFFANFHK